MTKKKIFAIVVTYNGLRWYETCFQSLKNSSWPLEVLVIDNASEDGSADHIQKYFPEIELIRSDTNLGFGKANNLGISNALKQGADYVFLLNQDAWIEPDTIETLANIHDENNNFGIISPLHINGTGNALDVGFQNYAGPEYTEGLLSDLCLQKASNVYETKFVNAAAWLISKKCLNKVGGFDPIFFHYGEDYNYCQRVNFHGMKVGIAPSARIYHDREYRPEKFGPEQILRHYLLSVADVNNDQYLKDKKRLQGQDYIRMLTGLFRGNLKKFRENWHNMKLKKTHWYKISESRKQNIKGGALYL